MNGLQGVPSILLALPLHSAPLPIAMNKMQPCLCWSFFTSYMGGEKPCMIYLCWGLLPLEVRASREFRKGQHAPNGHDFNLWSCEPSRWILPLLQGRVASKPKVQERFERENEQSGPPSGMRRRLRRQAWRSSLHPSTHRDKVKDVNVAFRRCRKLR